MNANAKRRVVAEDDNTEPQRYSTEARLAVVETRWQDVIPTLATKADVREATTKLQADIAIVKKDMDAMTNKIIIRVASIAVAAIAATGTIVALIQKLL